MSNLYTRRNNYFDSTNYSYIQGIIFIQRKKNSLHVRQMKIEQTVWSGKSSFRS